jgi:hypothetical protein
VLAIAEAPWAAWVRRLGARDDAERPAFSLRGAAVGTLVPLVLLSALVPSRLSRAFPDDVQGFMASLSSPRPNQDDEDAMERGYYENLMDVSRSNPQLAATLQQRPANWKRLEETDALVATGDFRLKELAPSRVTTVNGWTITTNRWGFRGREIDLAKPAGVFRLAVLDASTAMGWGVEDHETFAHLLETRLDREPVWPGFGRHEVLNFGVVAYSSTCDLVTLEKKALQFGPDAALFVANMTDEYWAMQRLTKSLRAGVEPPYDFVKEVVAAAGIDARTPEQVALRRLRPHRGRLVAAGYARFVRACRDHGAVPLWCVLPRGSSDGRAREISDLTRYAREAGFVVLDVADAFAGIPAESLALAPWDSHLGAKGHARFAERLHRALREGASLPVGAASDGR